MLVQSVEIPQGPSYSLSDKELDPRDVTTAFIRQWQALIELSRIKTRREKARHLKNERHRKKRQRGILRLLGFSKKFIKRVDLDSVSVAMDDAAIIENSDALVPITMEFNLNAYGHDKNKQSTSTDNKVG